MENRGAGKLAVMKTSPVRSKRNRKPRDPPYTTRNLAFQHTASIALSPLKIAQQKAAAARAEKLKTSPVKARKDTLDLFAQAHDRKSPKLFSEYSASKAGDGTDKVSPLKWQYLDGGSVARNNDKFVKSGYERKPYAYVPYEQRRKNVLRVSPVKRRRSIIPQSSLINIVKSTDTQIAQPKDGLNASHHVQADYYSMLHTLGTHRQAREALRQEEKEAQNQRARSLEHSLDDYFGVAKGRIDDHISKSLGGLPNRHVPPMSRFRVEHVPIVPPPPKKVHAQNLWYNSAFPENPNLLPVYDPGIKEKRPVISKYPENDIPLTEPERRGLRKSFFAQRGIVDASNGNLSGMNPLVGKSTLTLQVPHAHIRSLIYTQNNIASFDCVALKARFPTLTELNLGHNKLEELPQNFGLLAKLKKLSLHCNQLQRLPASLTKLCRLQELNVSANQLFTLPPGFWGMKKLERLDCYANKLTQLPDGLQRCAHLKSVNFSSNKILVLGVFPVPKVREDTRDYNEDDVWEKLATDTHHGYAYKNLRTHKLQAEVPTGSEWRFHNDVLGEVEYALEALLPPTRKKEKMLDFSKLLAENAPIEMLMKALAQAKESVWGCAVNVESGFVFYSHAITKETTYEMPNELDCIGHMIHMETMKFNLNGIRALPDSIGNMKQLVHLDLDSNRIRDIPISLCEIESLEILSMANNLVERLPLQLGRLTNLHTLRMQYNRINFIPGSIGNLKNIDTIWLGHNKIESLPRPFARLTQLRRLELFDNPIHTPAMWICEKGAQAVVWDCQRRLLEQLQGLPPAVKIVGVGVQNEVLVPEQRLKNEIEITINKAIKTGQLYLNWMGMTDFPKQLYENADKIQELRFVGHNLGDINPRIEDFCNLKIVYLSANKIKSIPAVFGRCVKIEELYLAENLLTELPTGICRLPKLRVLDVAHNKLRSVPKRLKTMRKLEFLNLNSNRIEEIPDGMSQMKSLMSLKIGSNQLRKIPNDFGLLPSITFINLNSNRLRKIPDSFARLGTLVELRLASNRLMALPKEIGRDVDVKGMYAPKGEAAAAANSEAPGEKSAEGEKGAEGEKKEEGGVGGKVSELSSAMEDMYAANLERTEEAARKAKLEAQKRLKKLKKRVTKMIKKATRLPTTEKEKASFRGRAVLTAHKMFETLQRSEVYNKALDRQANMSKQMMEKYAETEFAKQREKKKRRRRRKKKYSTPSFVIKGTLNMPVGRSGFLRQRVTDFDTITKLLNREVRGAEYPSSEESSDEELDRRLKEEMEIIQHASKDPRGVLKYKPSPLAASLKVLWLSGNNLRALPDSFGHFVNMERLTLELNPIVSPPRLISEFGPDMLELYFSVKSRRFNQMLKILQDEKLDIDKNRLTPISEGFWHESDQGYISPKDLEQFEYDVNAYLNGEFYLFRFTPRKLVVDIKHLKIEREQEHFREVLETFCKLLWLIAKERKEKFPALTEYNFVDTATQPWGEDKCEVDCFGVDLEKVFEPLPDQTMSLVDIYRKRKRFVPDAPHWTYKYAREHLEFACSVFNRPYGNVASPAAEVDFLGEWPESEDSDDEGETGKKKGEKKKKKAKKKKRKKYRKKDEVPPPNRRKAFSIQKFIYTDEEGARKADEDASINRRYELKLDRFEDYMTSKFGKKRLAKKNRLMRGGVSDEVGKAAEGLVIFQEKQNKTKEALEAIMERKKRFDEGKEFKFHNFRDELDVEDKVYEAERANEKALRAIDKQKEKVKATKKLFRRSKGQWEALVKKHFTDMIMKQVKDKVFERHRRRARHKMLRRLWDGRNGADYQAWLQENGPLHDERSYSSPSDSSGYDIGVDSDEEKDRIAEEKKAEEKRKKQEEFVIKHLAEIKDCAPEDVTREEIDVMLESM